MVRLITNNKHNINNRIIKWSIIHLIQILYHIKDRLIILRLLITARLKMLVIVLPIKNIKLRELQLQTPKPTALPKI